MAFPCPNCRAPVPRSPDSWLLRCAACGARLRARVLPDEGSTRVYDVEAVGVPDARTRVEMPWAASDERRLRRWLAWSTAVTLGLVFVLLALALASR
jgi:anti-sigma factor RsiW